MENLATKFIILVAIILFNYGFGQNNLAHHTLEKEITITFTNASFKEAITLLEQASDLSFAYNSTLLNSEKKLNRTYQNKAVREILDDMFQGEITYKVRGNYVLLKEAIVPKQGEIIIEGYVIDSKTNEKVPFASVYDTITLKAVISDGFGHYTFSVVSSESVPLAVKKMNYSDTVYHISAQSSRIQNLAIQRAILTSDIAVSLDSQDIQKTEIVNSFPLSKERMASFMNFLNPIRNKAQFSVVPSVGTNGMLSSTSNVAFSFNLLGGLNQGVRAFELGALFNMDLDSVKYVQIAWIFNLVGGAQNGLQIAGVFNRNKSSFNGLQVAGISNLTKGKLVGSQISGIYNSVKSYNRAFQLAGVANYVADSSSGVQLGGFANVTRDFYQGCQISGFANYANESMNGIQIAGFSNISRKEFRGIQLSGFLNYANYVKGAQLSFINISDSIDGIPIGFFSYSKKGLHQLEISTNEFLPIQIAFKSGNHKFYNSFILSSRFSSSKSPVYGGGYGVGSSIKLGSKSYLFFDLQAIQLIKKSIFENNFLLKGTLSYQWQLKRKFAIAIGPSFNVYSVENANSDLGQTMQAIATYNFYKETASNNRSVQMWVGGHLSVRLF